MLEEINRDREDTGKKPYDDDDFQPQVKTITKSTTDPESGLFHKGEQRNVLHTTLKQLMNDKILPVMPYTRPMTKESYFKKYEYVYDECYDQYICPNNKLLSYATTNKEGYREYKSCKNDCASCAHKTQCTASSQKIIARHVWQDYLDEVKHIRHTDYGKAVYSKRSETIERVFADAKEKHGLRYARHIGKEKVKAQVLMTFTCMNLKKLIKMLGTTLDKTKRYMQTLLKALFKRKQRVNLFA